MIELGQMKIVNNMEWYIRIQGIFEKKQVILPNERIAIRFNPKSETVHFIGQYKPHNREWVDFCEEVSPMDVDLDAIQNQLLVVMKKLSHRLKAYQNLSDGFSLLKVIEFTED